MKQDDGKDGDGDADEPDGVQTHHDIFRVETMMAERIGYQQKSFDGHERQNEN